MDVQLKRVLEVRRNDCKKVISFINSVNFSSLDDKQIRTLVMIRELGNGIVNRHRKLATEDDVSRTLKLSIEYMAGICRAVVEEISTASFEGASEEEKEVFMKILEIARGIADAQGPSSGNRCRDLNVPFEQKEEEEEDDEDDDDDNNYYDEEMGPMDGDILLQIESVDKEVLVVAEQSDMQERGVCMETELAEKEELNVFDKSYMELREVGEEIEMTDKEGLIAVDQSDVPLEDVGLEIVLTDTEGLSAVGQSDVQEREEFMDIELAHKEGLEDVEQGDVREGEVGGEITLAEEEGLTSAEQSYMQERELDMEIKLADKEGLTTNGRNVAQEEEVNVEKSLADKEGLTAVEQRDMPEVQIGAEIESGDKDQLDAVAQNDLQGEQTDADMRSGYQLPFNGQHSIGHERNVNKAVNKHFREPISWPLNGEFTQDWITNLMEALQWFSRNKSPSELSSVMPLPVVELLMTKASNILEEEPNCVKIECDNDTKVVVVGDLHGQYLDLLSIWERAGLPSENQLFVFNGSYVDRDLSSLELFLVLLAWKVFLPRSVVLLRGIHELRDSKKVEGFLKDINTKFPEYGRTVYRRCLETFAKLPLASVIAGCVYTCHGGLFRNKIKLESIDETETRVRKVYRKKQKTTPTLSLGYLDVLERVNRFLVGLPAKDSILADVLSSDPTMELGLRENDIGGAGLLWGPDCTETFLSQSKLKVIIRSHEGPVERASREGLNNIWDGYSEDHKVESGKLYTLFSAPDYPQYTSKGHQIRGAFAILKPPHFDTPEFVSFETTKEHEIVGSADQNAINSDEHQASMLSVNVSVDNDVPAEKNATDFGEEQGSIPLSPQTSIRSASFAPQSSTVATSSAADGEAVTPAPWIASLVDNADGSRPVQILEDTKGEGRVVEQNKANYAFLLNVIGSLKKEIKQKDNELEDYKRKYDSPTK